LLIEEKAHGMHQNVSQQAVTQMPQITRPDPLHLDNDWSVDWHSVLMR
jgi:hypothetical protein